ncbi:MAG TPA: FecR domain-containing protein [Candidatus Alistipes excrementipullorum]|nr:FecR domain-containing protein [Candidatus Alistipes excrementipullorum]
MTKHKRIIESFARNDQPLSIRKLFTRWLSSPTDAQEKNEALAELWEQTESFSEHTEQALKKTNERLFGEQRVGIRIPSALRWAIAAAIIAPLITVALSMLYVHDVRTSQSEWVQVTVPCGERRQLALGDGTQLWLGAGTRIIYPATFTGRERKVFIDGEVFAKVAHDPRHPFIISTSDANVRVLGTTFGLRAYNDDDDIELMLVEGSVSFDIDSPKYSGEILMSPSDMVRFDRRSGQIERSRFLPENYHSWAHDGSIYFFNESLDNITTQLSRRFNRQIVITDPKLLSLKFHVFLSNDRTLEDVLETFKMNKSIRIDERDNIIYISKK